MGTWGGALRDPMRGRASECHPDERSSNVWTHAGIPSRSGPEDGRELVWAGSWDRLLACRRRAGRWVVERGEGWELPRRGREGRGGGGGLHVGDMMLALVQAKGWGGACTCHRSTCSVERVPRAPRNTVGQLRGGGVQFEKMGEQRDPTSEEQLKTG